MRRLTAAAACCIAFAAGAADAPRWYLQIDNDVAFATDRWYSSGVRIARVAPSGDHELEWSLAQEVHTPDAKRFTLGSVDRAPAARLYLSLARHDRTPRLFQTAELALGVRGSAALGRQATELVHRLVPSPEVDWSRQGSNRVDAQLAFTQSLRFDSADIHYGAIAGNQVSLAHAGAALRFGPGARAVSTHLLRFAPTPPLARGDDHGWGGFVGASVRGIARNALLDSGYDPLAPAPQMRRAVGRAAAGVAWARPWGVVTFALALDSREFASQRDPHAFGAFVAHLEF